MSLPRVSFGARLLVTCAMTAALAAPQGAWSQAAPGGAPVAPPGASRAGVTAQELNPAARVPPVAQRDADLFAPEPPGPCPLAESTVQVTLTSVTFRGATALTPADFSPIYSSYIGKPTPVSAICEIRDQAARALFDRGILARVEIPEQRIAGGALVLDVIEARVVNVRVRGDIGPGQAAVERYVEKLRGMQPFDMRKAQRYLLLASDIPGIRVRAAVKPSTSAERGAVDIDIGVTREAYNAVANVQNMGSKTVGRWGGLLRGDLRSATAYGESTSLVAFHTLESNEQWVVQLLESARIGGDGLILRGSAVYGESRPGDVLKPLDLTSKSAVGSIEAAYPLLRNRRQNINVASGVELINQDTRAAGFGLLSRDHLRVLYARADGDARTYAGDLPVLLNGGLTLRKGLSGFGASSDGLTNPNNRLTRADSKVDAWLVRGNGGLDTAFTNRLSGSLRVQAQYTSQTLAPYEQLAVGSLTNGRGYDPATLLGDTGISGSAELRYGGMQLHPLVLASPYVFADAGYIHNNKAARSGLSSHRSLKSVGAGVTLRIGNRANLDLAYARPLDSATVGGRRQGGRVLVNLTASIL